MSDLVKQEVIYNEKTSEVVIRGKSKGTLRTPFSAVGPLTNAKERRRNMQPDVFDRLDQVSKGAFSVFRDLKYHRSVETNLTQFPDKDKLTRTQRETLSRRLKELKDVDVVRSVRGSLMAPDDHRKFNVPRGTFIINPELIRCLNHDESEHYWKQCGDE